MIRINLLPFRAARKKENIRRQVSIFLLSLILVIIGVCWYHMNLNSQIDEINTNINNTKQQLNKFRKINIEIAVIKKELNDLNKKLDVIKTLELNREGPVRLLDAMTGIIIPKRMWFTSLEEKETKETVGEQEIIKKVITINGTAKDNKTVADFMTRLQESKLFTNVDLLTLKQMKEGQSLNLKSFQIRCNKAPLESADEKAEKK